MKKFLIMLIAICPVAAFAQTRIINSWSDPNAGNANTTVHKLAVAALIYNQTVRRKVEDYMVSLYPGVATQSYMMMGDSLLTDEEAESRKLKGLGFDGILILKQTGENDQEQYVPGQPGAHYTTWAGYWSRWGPHPVNHYIPGTPGHEQNVYTWFVQASLFSLSSNKVIYSANTSTTKPGGTIPLFDDVSNAIKKELSNNGILP